MFTALWTILLVEFTLCKWGWLMGITVFTCFAVLGSSLAGHVAASLPSFLFCVVAATAGCWLGSKMFRWEISFPLVPSGPLRHPLLVQMFLVAPRGDWRRMLAPMTLQAHWVPEKKGVPESSFFTMCLWPPYLSGHQQGTSRCECTQNQCLEVWLSECAGVSPGTWVCSGALTGESAFGLVKVEHCSQLAAGFDTAVRTICLISNEKGCEDLISQWSSSAASAGWVTGAVLASWCWGRKERMETHW